MDFIKGILQIIRYNVRISMVSNPGAVKCRNELFAG